MTTNLPNEPLSSPAPAEIAHVCHDGQVELLGPVQCEVARDLTSSVLLVESSRLWATEIERLLTQAGSKVVTASSGREAIMRYVQEYGEVQAAVLDYSEDPRQQTAIFRALQTLAPELPMLVLYTDPAGPRSVIDPGPDCVLIPRSCIQTQLIGAMEQILQHA